jgi:hypothetical protein
VRFLATNVPREEGGGTVTTTDMAASGMTASDWTISILTGVLVLATIYYAVKTHQMVVEMRRARELQVRPVLVPAIRVLGPNDFYPKVANTGAGAAIDVRVTLTLEPDGPAAGYSAPVMTPGSDAGVIVRDGSRKIMHIDDYASFSTVRMRGTCRDVLGNSFEMDEVFDLHRFIEGFTSGIWARFPGVEKKGDPLKLIADALVNVESMMRADREIY